MILRIITFLAVLLFTISPLTAHAAKVLPVLSTSDTANLIPSDGNHVVFVLDGKNFLPHEKLKVQYFVNAINPNKSTDHIVNVQQKIRTGLYGRFHFLVTFFLADKYDGYRFVFNAHGKRGEFARWTGLENQGS